MNAPSPKVSKPSSCSSRRALRSATSRRTTSPATTPSRTRERAPAPPLHAAARPRRCSRGHPTASPGTVRARRWSPSPRRPVGTRRGTPGRRSRRSRSRRPRRRRSHRRTSRPSRCCAGRHAAIIPKARLRSMAGDRVRVASPPCRDSPLRCPCSQQPAWLRKPNPRSNTAPSTGHATTTTRSPRAKASGKPMLLLFQELTRVEAPAPGSAVMC